ncbi:MAG: hypothetical protein RJQ08_00655 [Salinisphaeraceae bacterium]
MPESDQPETSRRKARVWVNEAKNRQTTHWDVDLLPEAEVAALHRAGRRARWRRRAGIAGLAVGVVSIAGGVTAVVLHWVAG